MNSTKTAVIIGIVGVILMGAILWALRGNFTKQSESASAE